MVKSMLKILLVDDEQPARAELRYILSLLPQTEVIGEATDGTQAIALAADCNPDLIFLDINMPGISGLETAGIIRRLVPAAMIVFATAYDEYALKAFEIGAVDYVLKPFTETRIEQTVARVVRYQESDRRQAGEKVDALLRQVSRTVQKLPVEKSGKISLIDYENILYAYTSRGCVRLVTKEMELEYQGSLAELEEKLQGSMLRRVHKSYIVNLSQVSEVIPWFKGTYWLKLAGGSATEIPVSKSQIKTIKALLGL